MITLISVAIIVALLLAKENLPVSVIRSLFGARLAWLVTTVYQSAQDFLTKMDPVSLTGTYRPAVHLGPFRQ